MKTKFQNFIKTWLSNLSIKEQDELLDMAINEMEEYRKIIKDNKIHCRACGEYFDNTVKTTSEECTLKNECVYSDSGYGDTDEYADVTYLITFYICPYCGHKNEKRRMYLREANRWSRFDR